MYDRKERKWIFSRKEEKTGAGDKEAKKRCENYGAEKSCGSPALLSSFWQFCWHFSSCSHP